MLLFLLLGSSLSGQESNFGPCSLPADWNNIFLNNSELPESQVKILIATNRSFEPGADDGIFFTNSISDFRKVNYLLASCEGGKWTLSPVKDLSTGLKVIDDGGDILVYVHGHGKSFPQILTRSNQIKEKYSISMLVFDWPSYNFNFNKSLTHIRKCGENFYNLLQQLKQYRKLEMDGEQHLSLFMHSLGNYYLTHMVVNGNNQYMSEKIFDNIIMNAPAVRSDEHGNVISQLRIQERLFVVLNGRDRVLRGAQLLTLSKMLGNEPLKPFAGNSIYVDFSNVAGEEHTYFAGYHSFEREIPGVYHFFNKALHGEEVDFSNTSLFTPVEGAKIYLVNDASSP